MEQNQPQPPVFNQPQAPQPAPQYQPRVTARPVMGFLEAIKTCFKKYFDFKGRARRSEIWWFMLFCALVYFVGSIVMAFLAELLAGPLGVEPEKLAVVFVSLIALALFFPAIAVLTRRLHDTSRGGWWVALYVAVMLIYGVCYYSLMWPLLTKMGSNPFELAQSMTDAMMAAPTMATLMSVCGMLTFILSIVLLVFSLLDSKWKENKYGPSPKYQ